VRIFHIASASEEKLTSPWQVDPVASEGSSDTFPHIYGPINASAVVQAEPFPK
jgi:uncharacterized protein (DUF952 family)